MNALQILNSSVIDKLVCKCGYEVEVKDSYIEELGKHILSVHKDLELCDIQEFNCYICNKKLNTVKGLNIHMSRKHKDDTNIVENIKSVLN